MYVQILLLMQVIAAPTGSGKTGVLELAVLRLVSANITEDGDYVHKPGCLKAVYLAPSRALVQVSLNIHTSPLPANHTANSPVRFS